VDDVEEFLLIDDGLRKVSNGKARVLFSSYWSAPELEMMMLSSILTVEMYSVGVLTLPG
jgi:hypothetical protein